MLKKFLYKYKLLPTKQNHSQPNSKKNIFMPQKS